MTTTARRLQPTLLHPIVRMLALTLALLPAAAALPAAAPAEYGQIEETMSEEALDLVAGWIVERFAKPAAAEAPPG